MFRNPGTAPLRRPAAPEIVGLFRRFTIHLAVRRQPFDDAADASWYRRQWVADRGGAYDTSRLCSQTKAREKGMEDKSTVQRAFELAGSGTCRTIEDIRRRLTKEGYSAVQLH